MSNNPPGKSNSSQSGKNKSPYRRSSNPLNVDVDDDLEKLSMEAISPYIKLIDSKGSTGSGKRFHRIPTDTVLSSPSFRRDCQAVLSSPSYRRECHACDARKKSDARHLDALSDKQTMTSLEKLPGQKSKLPPIAPSVSAQKPFNVPAKPIKAESKKKSIRKRAETRINESSSSSSDSKVKLESQQPHPPKSSKRPKKKTQETCDNGSTSRSRHTKQKLPYDNEPYPKQIEHEPGRLNYDINYNATTSSKGKKEHPPPTPHPQKGTKKRNLMCGFPYIRNTGKVRSQSPPYVARPPVDNSGNPGALRSFIKNVSNGSETPASSKSSNSKSSKRSSQVSSQSLLSSRKSSQASGQSLQISKNPPQTSNQSFQTCQKSSHDSWQPLQMSRKSSQPSNRSLQLSSKSSGETTDSTRGLIPKLPSIKRK